MSKGDDDEWQAYEEKQATARGVSKAAETSWRGMREKLCGGHTAAAVAPSGGLPPRVAAGPGIASGSGSGGVPPARPPSGRLRPESASSGGLPPGPVSSSASAVAACPLPSPPGSGGVPPASPGSPGRPSSKRRKVGERWYAEDLQTMMGPSLEVAREMLPSGPGIRFCADFKNGRFLVAYAGEGSKSFSWTVRTVQRAYEEAHSWMWGHHTRITGAETPTPSSEAAAELFGGV